MDCYEFPCPVNCSVSQWSNWTSCSGDCSGEGYRSRIRNIEEAKYDGTCDEDLQQTENCTLSFSEWSDWSDCVINSISAKGVKLRFRVAVSSRDIKCYDTLVCHDSLLIFPTMIVVLTLLLFLTVVFVTTFIAFKKSTLKCQQCMHTSWYCKVTFHKDFRIKWIMYLGQIIFSAIAIRVRKTCLIERRLPKKRALLNAPRAISWVPSTAGHLLFRQQYQQRYGSSVSLYAGRRAPW